MAVYIFASAAALSICSACATRTILIGDWARPPELSLDSDSMKDVKVRVSCFKEATESQAPVARDFRLCAGIEDRLEELGAVVVASDQPADYTVQYIDSLHSDTTISYASLAGAVLTGWILPSISASTVSAELRILDFHGYVVDRAPLALTEVTAVGWLTAVGFFGEGEKVRKEKISRSFYQFVSDRLVSRLRLAKFAASVGGGR